MTDRLKKEDFARLLATRMNADEATTTAWIDGLVETLYESFKDGKGVTFPGFGGFEAKFARLQYAGNRRFHLSFMRHTGQWIQLYTDLTVDECIETIRDDPYFAI